ncbi:uncharacterized protein LOC105638706 isoform X2 [Jatropha curcas]|uniref:uncharacterized protein LOC105638706 isoform X2 n=1 Tax=Jatropha curcas TaxID=180498 RepID=UPI0005FB21B9|nr:uncharacterized protein LOC105638706 isoform X2 [Jatropha curcas]
MAVISSGPELKSETVAATEEKKSRSKCPGVRVIGGRIYDSQNGKTCHQCRQKTRDFTAGCKNQKGNKQCSINYCHKCLVNRYGEKAEEVALLDDWKCPKCRGICNCSFCRKKSGHKPTGILVRTAKENGFSSVSELLQIKGPENFGIDRIAKDADVSLVKPASTKDPTIASPRKHGKENSFEGNNDLSVHSQNLTPVSNRNKSRKNKKLQEVNKSNGGDDANLVGSGQKKPRHFDEVSKNKEKTNEEDEFVLVEKSRYEAQPRDVPKKEISMNGKAVGNLAEQKKSKKQTPKEVAVCCTTNEERNDTDCKHGVSNDVKNVDPKIKNKTASESCKINKDILEPQKKQIDDSISLPPATSLTTVAGIELPHEAAGHALQFFEFCAAFGEVLDVKKGQTEAVIREIIFGRRGRRSQGSLLAQFHIKLLSLIQEDIGEESEALSSANGKNSWLKALGKFFCKCRFISTEFPSDCFDKGNEGYDMLSASQKFKLLNFLCDEALNTGDLRSWIDDQNSKFVERGKEAKEKVLAAKDKEKQLKQKVQDEVAKAIMAKNGAQFSVSEHEAIVSQIKREAAQAHKEMLEAMGTVPKKRQRSDAVRTDPLLLDENGHAFWRLKGYNDKPDILLQDMGSWTSIVPEDKWFVYDAEQKQGIEKYISSLRSRRKF